MITAQSLTAANAGDDGADSPFSHSFAMGGGAGHSPFLSLSARTWACVCCNVCMSVVGLDDSCCDSCCGVEVLREYVCSLASCLNNTLTYIYNIHI